MHTLTVHFTPEGPCGAHGVAAVREANRFTSTFPLGPAYRLVNSLTFETFLCRSVGAAQALSFHLVLFRIGSLGKICLLVQILPPHLFTDCAACHFSLARADWYSDPARHRSCVVSPPVSARVRLRGEPYTCWAVREWFCRHSVAYGVLLDARDTVATICAVVEGAKKGACKDPSQWPASVVAVSCVPATLGSTPSRVSGARTRAEHC